MLMGIHTLPNYNSARRYCLLLARLLVCNILIFFSAAYVSWAETVPTNIIGNGLNTEILPQDGHVYGITGGTPIGTNLFHSFAQFNVGTGDIAQFQTLTLSQDPTIQNILGRITDQNPSTIFGAIDSATFYPNANLFLMHPHGFLFGPNATVNVGGMIAFTSADYLRLSDNARLNAIPDIVADALLTASPVVAFGFLGINLGEITVQGSQLTVTGGTGISLVGGNITIGSGPPDGGLTQPAQLSAPNGKILLASAASAGEFDATTLQPLPSVNGASFTSFGSVLLAPGSLADVSGVGKISIRGGAFTLEFKEALLSTETIPTTPGGDSLESLSLAGGSTIVSATAGEEVGPNVQLSSRSISLVGSSITSVTTGEGAGGAITVTAEDRISLTGGAQIVTQTEGAGGGGDISVQASSSSGLVTISGFDPDGTVSGVVTPFLFNPLTGEPLVASGIYSLTSGSVPGGHISITAPTVSLQDGAVVATVTSGTAPGGKISISSGMFDLTSGASLLSSAGQDFISPDFLIRGTGHGGDIIVTATDSMTISGNNPDLFRPSSISTQTYNPVVDQALDQGHGGAITLTASNIILEDGGSIVSGTQGMGTGGAVSIIATNSLSVSGFSQDLGSGSSIMSLSFSSGTPSGDGGDIHITASSVTIEDGGLIAADKSSVGNGGDIALAVGDLTLRNGGSIASSSSNDGSSGHIQITATGTLSISGKFSDPNNADAGSWSAIKNMADDLSSTGNGGIDIHVGKLIMQDGPLHAQNQDVGQIESNTGASAGGTIRIVADSSISMLSGATIVNRKGSFESGAISLEAPSISLDRSALHGRTLIDRDAGAIALHATAGNLTLSNDSHVITSTLQSSGTAGPIVAEASDSILLSGGSTIESSSSPIATGDGGAVTLIAGSQIRLSGTGTALRSTTEGSGTGGTITLNANQVQINNGSAVSSSSTGSGNTGNIHIDAGHQFTMTDSSVTTESTQSGGGAIKITTNPGGTVQLTDSMISASVLDGTGGGGSVNIDPQSVILVNSQILATAIQGAGGNIFIATNLLLLDGNSTISASSQFGQNGTITIQSPNAPISGQIHPLGKTPLLATSLLTQQCASVAGGQFSSFTVAGRDSVPTEPGSWLVSPLAMAGVEQGIQAGRLKTEGGKVDGRKAEGGKPGGLKAEDERPDRQTLTLRQIAPAGFLPQAFAVDRSAGCRS